MEVNDIFTKARRDCHIEETDYENTDAIIDANLINDDLISTVVDLVDEDFFWDSSVDDFIAGQSEYPVETTSGLDILEVNKIFIKYTETSDFTPARRVSPLSLTKHPSRYTVNQSQGDPIYYFQDNSIFVYPAILTTEDDVTAGIEIFTINMPSPLEIDGEESTIKIPKRFHRLYPLGLKQHIYMSMGKLNEKNDAINEYEQAKVKMVQQLKDRDQGEIIETIPDLSHLE